MCITREVTVVIHDNKKVFDNTTFKTSCGIYTIVASLLDVGLLVVIQKSGILVSLQALSCMFTGAASQSNNHIKLVYVEKCCGKARYIYVYLL
jgi:hypothetical protein